MRRIIPALAAITCLVLPPPSFARDSSVTRPLPPGRHDPLVVPVQQPGYNDPDDPYVWHVYGLPPGGLLAIRSGAGLNFRVIGELAEGMPVKNLGCLEQDTGYWCRIATTDRPRVSGWVNGRFLVEDWGSNPPPYPDDGYLLPGNPYDATGRIRCRLPGFDGFTSCDYGIVRNGPMATIEITAPDGSRRRLDYRAGRFTGSEGSEVRSRKQGGDAVVTVDGAETYYVPDTVVMGDD
ncbi:SH3 domain-containing protein [Ciceribacter sp. RN22]|uniref:SH3 domain-containing protein n=1 Tax=Ciceribacter sp. RN22 TaxID=2954932 RepID=UPI002092C6A3|nr:SH3 domain-containing protein [Ciceribacter sp. RN22]MCO6180068.1 SH3 domain-containing protein [Ciceribacter sp. RN22]